MALTQRLAFIIDAKSDGAIRNLKAIDKELDQLEKQAKQAGVAFDRVGERNARLSGLQKTIAGVSAATGLSEEKVKTLGIAAGTAGAAFAVAFGVKSVQAASALNEQLSRSRVVFGAASGEVQKFAEAGAKIGLSKTAALEAAGGFGTLFTNIGQTKDVAAQMSERLVALAADLASFSNTSVADALAAIQSGLNGEQEPLRRYAVFLSDATLKQRALADGLISTTSGVLTPAQRALAAYNEILGQTALQQGDFARTQDGFANSTRTLQANLENLEASIGEKLIPAITEIVNKLNEIGPSVGRSLGPLSDLKHKYDEIAGIKFPGLGKILDPNDELPQVAKGVGLIGDAFKPAKGIITDVARDTGLFTKQVNLNTTAFKQVEAAQRGVVAGLNSQLAVAQPVAGSWQQIKAAVDFATGAYQRLDAASRSALQGASAAILAANGAVETVRTLTEGPGSHAPAPQVNEVLLSFGEGLARYRANLEDATHKGVGDGIDEAKKEADDLANYLQAVMRDKIEKLGNVFDAISGNLSFDDAKRNVDEATQKVADLRAEAASTKAGIAQQASLVGQLTLQAVQITPEEQVAIERAEKNLEDVKARFYGLATQTVAAPGSSFLGPSTISVAGPKASLAELQVAENDLAKAKADAVGPTRELEEAQRKLDDLRKRQQELPKLIADAERDLFKAKSAVVEAQRREIEAGKAILEQGPEFLQQYKDIAAQAGLTAGEIDKLAASYLNAARAGASSQGLVDVFGNGTKFATPADANAILSYISGINGGGPIQRFASGGFVNGPVGMPQLAVVEGGERILTANEARGGAPTFNINISAWDQGSIPAIAKALRSEVASMLKRAS